MGTDRLDSTMHSLLPLGSLSSVANTFSSRVVSWFLADEEVVGVEAVLEPRS